ncbi:MAG: acyl-[acyl-carrier-protein] thioesterase [Hungatella sp.]|nr:acyl-[acyl-carrier-protein] thioesterase [Hungatella sp.]
MYHFDSRVRYSETDEKGQLSLTGILNYFQDCSTFQSEDLGMGVRYLSEHNRAWWLTSWQIIIDRYPILGERIVVSTWPYDFKGIYGYRNFTLQNLKGEYLVRAASVWFLFDTRQQRPIRVQESDIRGYGTTRPRLEMDYTPRKIEVPKEYEEKKPVLVERHHLDTNHHVNNAQYVEIAKECLPDDIDIKELRAEYKKAAVLGNYMTPRISRTQEGYITALCDAKGSPHAVIWLRESDNGGER